MAWWVGLLSSVLGNAMNKQNPEIKDVNREESVLSKPSPLESNGGGSGGFLSALSNMDFTGNKDDTDVTKKTNKTTG